MDTIAFSGGGTLGHITPALSFIKKIKQEFKNKYRIIYIATTKDKDYNVLNQNIYIDQIYYLEAYGRSSSILKYPIILYHNLTVLNKIKKILVKENVKVLIGMGGYISGLCLVSSNKLKIKTMIHEQNSVMGFANKLSSKYASRILISFKDTKGIKRFSEKTVFIGNPRFDDCKYLTNDFDDKKNILITSGTLGAKIINDVVVELINDLDLKGFTITLLTGKRYYEEVLEKLKVNRNIMVKAFSNNLLNDMKNAGIVISRAGSSTLFEILGLKKPSIVIPSVNVTDNHQYYNALNLLNDGLVKVIEEKNLSKDTLLVAINDVINNYDIYKMKLKEYQIESPLEKFMTELVSLL